MSTRTPAIVEEFLLLRLSRNHGNLCVVGDDDQSIYRFRGASVQNLLEFPERTFDGHAVELSVNYRSHAVIVDFYNRWMAGAADWSNPDPRGSPFRYPKSITPHDAGAHPDYPAVIAVEGSDAGEEGRQLAELVRFLKRQSVIAGYDQVALLLHSVKGPHAVAYLDALESAGIPVNRAPSGSRVHRRMSSNRALTVTTIHQAKGREWDVVIVGSLSFDNADVDPVGRELAPYCRRSVFEPADRIAEFDHARQHYVAFSRPKKLLVLTANRPVHPRFVDVWDCLPRWEGMTVRRWPSSGSGRQSRPMMERNPPRGCRSSLPEAAGRVGASRLALQNTGQIIRTFPRSLRNSGTTTWGDRNHDHLPRRTPPFWGQGHVRAEHP